MIEVARRPGRLSAIQRRTGRGGAVAHWSRARKKDHFYALAEVCEKVQEFKGADDRAQSTAGDHERLGGAERRRGHGRCGSSSDAKGGLAVLEHAQDEPQVRREPREPLPSNKDLKTIVKQGAVAIVSLEGYSDALRQSLVASILQRLLAERIDDQVPRFLTVIEEAHNFIPEPDRRRPMRRRFRSSSRLPPRVASTGWG